jgi:hypothetical protein
MAGVVVVIWWSYSCCEVHELGNPNNQYSSGGPQFGGGRVRRVSGYPASGCTNNVRELD